MKKNNENVIIPASIFSKLFELLHNHAKLFCIIGVLLITIPSIVEIYKIYKTDESKKYVSEHVSSVTTVVNSPHINTPISIENYHWMDESQANRNGPNDWWAPYVKLTYEQKLSMIRLVNKTPNYNRLSGKEILNLYFQNNLISESQYKTIMNNCKEL